MVLDHLLWAVIMQSAIRNRDYRTAVYSPKLLHPGQSFSPQESSHTSSCILLCSCLLRDCGLCYIVSHCCSHFSSTFQTTPRALTSPFLSCTENGCLAELSRIGSSSDHMKQICLDPLVVFVNLVVFLNSSFQFFLCLFS